MKKLLAVALIALMMVCGASAEQRIVRAELDTDWLKAPAAPVPRYTLYYGGHSLYWERSEDAELMVYVPNRTELRLLAEYKGNWWRVGAKVGGVFYTGYMHFDAWILDDMGMDWIICDDCED